MDNLFTDISDVQTFAQYAVSDAWETGFDEANRPTLTTSITTIEDIPYRLEFSIAANVAAGAVDVAIQVSYGGETIGTFNHSGALFDAQEIVFTGTGKLTDLTFTIVDNSEGGSANIVTDAVIPYYEKTMIFGGQEVTVQAFVPGAPYIYQILSGQLVKFDPETSTYEEAETAGTYQINAIGLNKHDDIIYGIARQSSVDSLGNAVVSGDVVAVDAGGKSYLVGHSGYSHYVGDLDGDGNLWTFPGDASYAVRYDVSNVDENGNIDHVRFDLNTSLKPGLADLAYDANTDAFYGVTSKADPKLVKIDISDVPFGGEAVVTTTPIVATIIDGVRVDDTLSMTYGAAVSDADGNIYVGGNSGDHDLDSSTPTSGGIYRIDTDENGNLVMVLMSAATPVGSNDGAMDPRVLDPFLEIDTNSEVLLFEPVLETAVAEDDSVVVTARGDASIDLLANDRAVAISGSEESPTLEVTHIDGVAVVGGETITLASGTVVTYSGNGILSFAGADRTDSVLETLDYTVSTGNNFTDTATLSVLTSPIDGTAGDDTFSGSGEQDTDGNILDGSDGASEVVMGYGGNDKLFTGEGDDALYGGDGDDNLRGEGGNDTLYGGDGNDLMSGGSGIDTIYGGAGNDFYWVDTAQDMIEENADAGTDKVLSMVDWTLGDNFENLSLEHTNIGGTGIAGTGNELDNSVSGNNLDNQLDGLGGDDHLMGLGGDDTMFGGDGNDNIQGGTGNDIQYGGAGDDMMHGEQGNDIQYGGDGNDTLCPNVGDDIMYGGAGDDLLSGLAGTDVAYGGEGNDVYKIQDSFDTVIEYENEGIDTVHSFVSFTLSDHVEHLTLTGAGDLDGHGNDLANTIVGNNGENELLGHEGNDHIEGAGGDDVIAGGEGNDRLFGSGGNDVASGQAGTDRLAGGIGNDDLNGGAGNDVLYGGTGSDTLRGGAGDDLMKGNAGADAFVFSTGDGADGIRGWSSEDTLIFEGLQMSDLEISQQGRNTVINYGDSDTIKIYNTDHTTLTAEDFVFA